VANLTSLSSASQGIGVSLALVSNTNIDNNLCAKVQVVTVFESLDRFLNQSGTTITNVSMYATQNKILPKFLAHA
jgi:hypothetical protein